MALFDYIVLALVVLLAYAWVGYPVVLGLLARGKSRSAVPAMRDDELPNLTVVFSAHNEAAVIADRLQNLLDVDYPHDRLSVLVGVDGGTDRTGEIAREIALREERVEAHVFDENRGKVAVLKDLVAFGTVEPRPESSPGCKQMNTPLAPDEGGLAGNGHEFEIKAFGDVAGISCADASGNSGHSCLNGEGDGGVNGNLLMVNGGEAGKGRKREAGECKDAKDAKGGTSSLLVFTDANSCFSPDVFRKLAAHFSDERVGGVCGRLVFTEGNPFTLDEGAQNPSSEGAYWRWETLLKTQESRLDSCLGANGAIYAIRRHLFWSEIPVSTIIDDFVIGMKVREQGGRVIYDSEAVAYEELPHVESEWGRRVRIGAGDYQAVTLCRRCLSPKFGLFAWSFWSHKVLRWFTPHLTLALLVISYWLFVRESKSVVMGTLSASVLVGMVLGLLCVLLARTRLRIPGVGSISHFVTMQAALLVGFLNFCRGNLKGAWSRTPRS